MSPLPWGRGGACPGAAGHKCRSPSQAATDTRYVPRAASAPVPGSAKPAAWFGLIFLWCLVSTKKSEL